MPVPVPSAHLSLAHASDAPSELDREILPTIPIRIPHTPLPEATASESPVPAPPLSDAELLGAFVERRDADAFTEIVQRYRQMVYRVALRAVEDRHLADDVFQATFLVLAQSARKIKSGEVLPAWLHGTARNIARRALSNQHTERQRLAALATQTLAEKGGEMNTSTAVDPFDELVRHHEQQLLDEELQQLPEASRAPLVLYYLEEKTQAEIAQLMGLTVEAVEGRLKRAKQELRARLIRRGVLLSTVVAAATVLTPAITAAAPTTTLVSATVTTALGTAALGSTALAATAATGTAASTSLATGVTTAAKLAAQEVAAMSAASKATVMFVTTAVSTTVATGLLFGAIAGSLLGGKGVTPAVWTSPVEEFVSPMNIVRDEVGPNPFAWEGEEPVVLALGGPEGEDAVSTQPMVENSVQAYELKAIVHPIADLIPDHRKLAAKFAEPLADSVALHEETQSLVVRATQKNHKKIGDYLTQLRDRQGVIEELNPELVKTELEMEEKLQRFSDNHPEVEQLRERIALLKKMRIELYDSHNGHVTKAYMVADLSVENQRALVAKSQSLSKTVAFNESSHILFVRDTEAVHEQITQQVKGIRLALREEEQLLAAPADEMRLQAQMSSDNDDASSAPDNDSTLTKPSPGFIKSVTKDNTNRVASVKITLGKSDGLAVGNTLNVNRKLREDQYTGVGQVHVIHVDEETALCDTTLLDKSLDFEVGDEVWAHVPQRGSGRDKLIAPFPGEAVQITKTETTIRMLRGSSTKLNFPERITTVDGFAEKFLSVEVTSPEGLRVSANAHGETGFVATGESKKTYKIRVLCEGEIGDSAGATPPAADPAVGANASPLPNPNSPPAAPLSSVEDQSVELQQPAGRVFLQVTAFDADQETIAKLATKAEGGENLLLPQPGMLEQFKSLSDAGRVRTGTDQTIGVPMGNPGAILGVGEFAVPDAAGNSGMRFQETEYFLILTPQARNKNDELSVEYQFEFSERVDLSAIAFPEKKIPGLSSRTMRGNVTLPGDGNGVLIGPWVKESAPSGDGNGVTPNRTYIWIRERRFDLGWESYGMRLGEIPRGSESLKRTDFRGGMLIREIRPTSPAESQGIQPGDILVGLNQWETLSPENVMHALKQPEAKTTPLKFYVVRDGKTLHGQMTIKPGEFSTNDEPTFQAPEAPMLSPPAEAISKPLTSPSRRAVHKPSVRDALAEPVDIEIDAMPLSKFLNLLADLPGIGAVGYSPKKNGFDASVRVSITAKGCTWKTVLRALAPAIHPEARFIENGETLMLARVNRTDMKLSAVAYDISKSTKTHAEVEEFIRTFVNPHQDRKFQMSRVENILVMKTTLYRHLLLEDFLAQPELAADGTPLPDPVIRVTREQDKGAAEAPKENPGTGDTAE